MQIPLRARPLALTPLVLAFVPGGAGPSGQGGGERAPSASDPPVYTRWETYGVEDGLPSERVLCVLFDGESVWAGTEKGLARLRDGAFEVYGPDEGLAHPVVSSLALSEETGDLWIGTLGGLSRWSAGRLDTFDQLNSGLINDVVYAVAVVKGDVWAATASGVSVYHPTEKRWELYNHENTVMHEPWCYWLTSSSDKVYVAVWGGGVVEHDPSRGTWKAYRDPDGEMEIDLIRDDGLVHDVTSSVSYSNGVLWVGTYFGLSRYDGRAWRSFLEHDTPLPSNFVNSVLAVDGWVWVATDNGLAASDGERWVVYLCEEEGPGGSIRIHSGDEAAREVSTASGLGHPYVFGVAPEGERLWVATAQGLSLGLRDGDPGDGAAGPDRSEEGR